MATATKYKPIKGFKGFKIENGKMSCRGTVFVIGKKYEMKSSPICCERGFHFCKDIQDVHCHYNLTRPNHVFCEVESLGKTHEHFNKNKIATNHIHIKRLVPLKELWLDHLKAKVDSKKRTCKFRLSNLGAGKYSITSVDVSGQVLNSNWEPISFKSSKEIVAAYNDNAMFTATATRYMTRKDGTRHYIYIVEGNVSFQSKPVIYQNLTIKIK